jgi:hypothetical protein
VRFAVNQSIAELAELENSVVTIAGSKAKSAPPEDFWANVAVKGPDECWEWQAGMNSNGYGQVRRGGKGYNAHRMAYILTYGPISNDLHILHSCNNPPCCNFHHLRAGTNLDNAQDRVKAGTNTLGEANGCAILTTQQVLDIRQMYKTGNYTFKTLGAIFNIKHRTIGDIVNRRRWKHI